MVGALTLLAVAVVAAVLILRPAPESGDAAEIRKLIENFAVAIEEDDQTEMLSLLCNEEAEAIKADDDYDPSDTGAPGARATTRVKISDIRVSGDVASARLTHPSRLVTMLYLQKEAGGWKVCASAGDRMPATPGATG